MTRTTEYVIYLCGSSNAYNKPMNNAPVPVGLYEGAGRTATERRHAAIDAAGADGVTTYNGQYLDAKPLSRTSQADLDAAYEEQRIRAARQLEADVWYEEAATR